MARGRARGDLDTGRWKHTRKSVLNRDGHECQIGLAGCTRVATCVDHIVPHALGGSDTYENLRAACKPCNSRLGARQRAGGPVLTDRFHPPSPPSSMSLVGPRDDAMRTRVYRSLPS